MLAYYTFLPDSSLKNKHKLSHDLSYKLLAYALKNEYGIDISTLILLADKHGKPYFQGRDELQFNISHSGDIVLCAISDKVIGVDVEKIRSHPEKVVNRVFSERERLQLEASDDTNLFFFRIWTLKEAYVKTLGVGISYPMKTVSFELENLSEIKCSNSGYSFFQDIIGEEYIVSICVESENGCSLNDICLTEIPLCDIL